MKDKDKLKTIIEKIKSNKFLPYIIIILFGIVTTIPLFTMNLSDLNEFRIHIGRVTTIKEVMQDGVFPPFISYKHMLDFGYALNIFYGCLTTYIPIAISLLTDTSAMAIKIFTLVTVILSGITMYIFTYRITKSKVASTISALVYMAGPYKYTDIYSRNAVGEYTAFIFIPMVFIGIYDLLNNEKRGNKWLIAGASLLILSHTITTIYTAIFALFFIGFSYKKAKNIKFWKSVIIDVVIVLLLTSFYTFPLIEHKLAGEYVIYDAESMNATGPKVYKNANSIGDWFNSELSHDELIFSFGLAITFLMFITIFCYKKVDKKYKDLYATLWIISLIALFMSSKAFPWIAMPHVLTVIQFAWRINGFFLFFIATVCGINALVFSDKLYRVKGTIIGLIIAVIFVMGMLGTSKYIENFEPEKDKTFDLSITERDKIGPYNINRDYMPLRAMDNIKYLQNRENRTYILEGEANIVREEKYRLNDVIEIKDVKNAKLELPFLYYKGYTIKINGQKVDYFESENGFICIDVNENAKIEITYTGSNIEYAGMLISAITLIILAGYKIINSRNIKHSSNI